MRRPRALIAALALLGFALYLFAPLPAPNVARASAGDCLTMRLWSNGYHADIGVPMAALPAEHPLRQVYPDAEMLLIGWGDRAFYLSDGTDLWLGLRALIPPSPGVMHVAQNAERDAVYLGPSRAATLAISREGAARLAAFLARAVVLDETGRVQVVQGGKRPGRSVFIEAEGGFNLFNVCNHWMARALRAAGLNVNPRSPWLGAWLIADAERAAESVCPEPPAPMLTP